MSTARGGRDDTDSVLVRSRWTLPVTFGEGTSRAAWVEDHPVLQVLRERRDSGSQPGARTDEYRVGLALEGGGMRGVVSAAMITALEDLGLTDAFDAVFGASSGSVNAAYFLAGDSWYPLSIYYDDLTTTLFLDFRRALRGKPMLNLDYAFDIIVERLKPLDFGTLLSSPIEFHIAVTSVDDKATLTACRFAGKEDMKAALRASGWLPVATRGTAMFRDKRVIDGGVLVSHPFRFALDDGCTHVLSLSTRPIQPPRQRPSLLQRFTAMRLNRMRAGLGDGFLRSIHLYAKERAVLARARTEPPAASELLALDQEANGRSQLARINLDRSVRGPVPDPFVLDLAPLAGTPQVKRHEMDRGLLIQGARSAYEVIVLAIERKSVRVIPRLTIPEFEHGRFLEPEHG
jgi:predicted patatin/cPLA2 family phospholipase